ncbi:MAG: glycoside hydrolase family 28 protein [Lachnospiraceae bacterium]|nr:glycoside hydrolase family 28 protein [Lachnospiraceae bacterium]
MKFQIVAITVRSITLELLNDEIYESWCEYNYYIDGKKRLSSRKNVVSIFGLEPNTEYRLCVERDFSDYKEIVFTTSEESVLFDVKEFGAIGDGVTDDTEAIQAAVYACPNKGTVHLRKGTYRCAPIFLKSHITLWIDKGAVILGMTDRSKYPVLPGMVRGTDEKSEFPVGTWEGNPLDSFASLITGIDVEDVHIIGEGTVDGNAQNADWWMYTKVKKTAWRPNTIFLARCKDICVQGITVQNSPSWTVHPYYSENLGFYNLFIQNPYDSPNTDGFDPESCKDVTMLGTKISVGDDCIAIKSGKYYMSKFHFYRTSNITVRNCKLERGHGSVTIGSEVSCGVENVSVSKCIFEETDRGIRLKTRRGRGDTSVINNLNFENIKMKSVPMPMTINMFYFCDPDGHSDYVQSQEARPLDDLTPKIGRINARHIDIERAGACIVCAYGLPESPIEQITLEDVNASFLPKEEAVSLVPIMMDNFPAMSAKSFFFKNVKSVNLKNVNIAGSADKAPEYINVEKVNEANTKYN